MAKTKQTYICRNCQTQHLQWSGKCNSCGEWNTIEKITTIIKKNNNFEALLTHNTPTPIDQIAHTHTTRIDTKNTELNRVLGGGLVHGTLILIGGEPGIGKSTLALQIALQLTNYKTLYISGEESPQQIKLRATRIATPNHNTHILTETSLENITAQIKATQPDIIIIDSIQTIHTQNIEASIGSITQIKECSNQLQHIAKQSNIPIILISHINKEGNLAGPKALEHIVDTVLHFEGDTHHLYRILRTTKNRYGSTNEIGIYEMNRNGLTVVANPSQLLLAQHNQPLGGITTSATIEGNRPFLIEVQALVSSAVYGTPQRTTTGFDTKRLNMLLAVLEKKARFNLATKDVFINIAGGIKVNDPANDLAVITAVLSSNIDTPVTSHYCFAGEVGLSGEIRPVTRIDIRIKEAEKLGFKKIFISAAHNLNTTNHKLTIAFVEKIEDVFKQCFRQ